MLSLRCPDNGPAVRITSDILVCKHCGTYADGMPDGRARPNEKRCKVCHQANYLQDAAVEEILSMLNDSVLFIPEGLGK